MKLLIQSFGQWLRRTLAWSNSWQSWKERLGAALLALAVFALLQYGGGLSRGQKVSIWATLLVAAALLWRHGWLKLFGPVLFYDLIRVGRRSRYILLRSLYLAGLLFILFWVWYWDSSRLEQLPLREMAAFAERLFFTFMAVQLVLVTLLTPAYVAGAIAEEKDRKTMEYLLATDLRNREIVLSKLVARICNMLFILLAGLPVLSFLQFFGGVDPDLLLASFVASGLVIVSLASLSILTSVRVPKPRDAIILTYLAVFAYHLISFLVYGLYKYYNGLNPPQVEIPLGRDAVYRFPVTDLAEVVHWINAGNLLLALTEITIALHSGQTLADVLPDLLFSFAVFHLLLAGWCTSIAVLRVRRIALKEAFGQVKKGVNPLALIFRPRIGNLPMLWKEVFAESGLKLSWLGWIIAAALVVVSFLPVYFIFMEATRYGGMRPTEIAQAMNVYVRIVGTLVACLMLLGVAVRAAGTLSGERDRQTMDSLLTTPLEAPAILLAKWAGSIAGVRWGMLWLGLIWLLGVATGGLHPLAIPLLFATWLIYAGVFACVGVWFSLASRTTLRATVWTVLSAVFLGGGHWLAMGIFCYMPLAVIAGGRDLEYVVKFEFGQTPPLVMGLFAFAADDFRHFGPRNELVELIGFSVLGLGTWAISALILGTITHARFEEMTLRQGSRRPELHGWSQKSDPALAPAAQEGAAVLTAISAAELIAGSQGATVEITKPRPGLPDTT